MQSHFLRKYIRSEERYNSIFLISGGEWGGGERKGFYAAVHLMWFILPERELKVSSFVAKATRKCI